MLWLPTVSWAESQGQDRPDTNSYTNEDSQFLKLMSYVFAPVGFALEWTVARPLHYLATETFLAPVLGAHTGDEGYTSPAAEIPPPGPYGYGPELTPGAGQTERPKAPVQATGPPPQRPARSTLPAPQSGPSQPVLH